MNAAHRPAEEEPMHIGVCIFATDYSIRIDELAREAEARGFESLWVPEHTHIPTSRRTPFAGGDPLPREYSHTHDPFVALMAAAAATTRLMVGTGICLIIERDTIVTAKCVASLDALSGGRFLFGIGGGWNVEEMENHGTVFKTRFKRLREQVLAMKEIWTKDEAEFHGDFVRFDPIWAWPKPVQKPHPPVLLGGESGYTLQRIVDFCDGWFPRGRASDRILPGLADLRARAERAGRDPKTISTSVFGAPADQSTLDRWAEAGVTRGILRLPSESRDTVLPLLDQWVKLLRR
jgi:probable F420-dependent oxidoreductase